MSAFGGKAGIRQTLTKINVLSGFCLCRDGFHLTKNIPYQHRPPSASAVSTNARSHKTLNELPLKQQEGNQ
jgi:hypothetical protein